MDQDTIITYSLKIALFILGVVAFLCGLACTSGSFSEGSLEGFIFFFIIGICMLILAILYFLIALTFDW